MGSVCVLFVLFLSLCFHEKIYILFLLSLNSYLHLARALAKSSTYFIISVWTPLFFLLFFALMHPLSFLPELSIIVAFRLAS